MIRILDAALSLQAFCAERDWHFCFIGGLAVQRWGEPRNTQDADLTLITGFGSEEAFVDALLSRFAGRREDARDFALNYRVLLLRAGNGVPLDVALGAMPFEMDTVRRSSLWQMGDAGELRTCSAEDLLVHKAFAGRERDWLDIEGILVRQKLRLDLALVKRELRPLLELKEDDSAWPRFDQLCRQCGLSIPA